MSRIYTTKTPSLKATIADIRNLDVKNLSVKGKSVPVSAKHPDDTREVITENDMWASKAKVENGEIIFYTEPIATPVEWKPWNTSITKVENKKAYIEDSFYANIETDKITNANCFFDNCKALTSYEGDLLNAESTWGTFGFSSIPSINIKAPKSKIANTMFARCNDLKNVVLDLENAVEGWEMFYCCESLETAEVNLPKIKNNCDSLFNGCVKLKSFTGDLSSLEDGDEAFNWCLELEDFNSILPNLSEAYGMFYGCKLSPLSVMNILHSIPSYTEGIHVIDIGINVLPGDNQLLEDFAKECATTSWADLKNEFEAKGWTVRWTYCDKDVTNITV